MKTIGKSPHEWPKIVICDSSCIFLYIIRNKAFDIFYLTRDNTNDTIELWPDKYSPICFFISRKTENNIFGPITCSAGYEFQERFGGLYSQLSCEPANTTISIISGQYGRSSCQHTCRPDRDNDCLLPMPHNHLQVCVCDLFTHSEYQNILRDLEDNFDDVVRSRTRRSNSRITWKHCDALAITDIASIYRHSGYTVTDTSMTDNRIYHFYTKVRYFSLKLHINIATNNLTHPLLDLRVSFHPVNKENITDLDNVLAPKNYVITALDERYIFGVVGTKLLKGHPMLHIH